MRTPASVAAHPPQRHRHDALQLKFADGWAEPVPPPIRLELARADDALNAVGSEDRPFIQLSFHLEDGVASWCGADHLRALQHVSMAQ